MGVVIELRKTLPLPKNTILHAQVDGNYVTVWAYKPPWQLVVPCDKLPPRMLEVQMKELKKGNTRYAVSV